MYNARSNQKPPLGTPLNAEHPLAPYLDLYLPFLEGQGSNPWELVRSTGLTSVGTGKPTWVAGPLGGLVPRLSTSASWSIVGPGQYGSGTSTGDFSFAFWINPASLSGGFYIANTGPYGQNGWALLNNGGNALLDLRINGVSEFFSASSLATNAWQHWCVVRHGAGVSFYLNGKFDTLTYGTAGPPNIVATTGQTLYLNCYYGGGSGQGNVALDDVMFFKGLALSAAQVADLYARPWQLFGRRPSLAAIPAITPTIYASPTTVYANGANQVVALTGYDRSWTPGSTSTFSIAGQPAGVSIASQGTTDAGHGSVTLATGSATGTATITDGTASVPIAVQAISFAATPGTVPANHAGHITLNLSGAGTLWQSGTTAFSISGVGGASIVSQSVASATSATLVIATGAGTGTLTISDGAHSATIRVAAAAVSATVPTAPVATGTYSLAIAGTNTVWTQETAASLFTVSGIAGATVSNIQVVSNTAASATLTLGSSKLGGAITIADASTGAMSGAIGVAAVPSGSLHATGPCLLVHTGGATGAFGGKAAATIAFRFQADSTAGIAGAGGTTVIGWGTNTYGGVGLAVWSPATSTLTITAYGGPSGSNAFGSYSATIPVQIGTGYHFLISWLTAAQPSFTGTTASGSYTITGIPSTAGLMVGDLIAGTGIPTGTIIQSIPSSTQVVTSNPGTANGTVTISVTRGTQTLYVNGVAYSTQPIPYPTYAYQQIQVGGNGGAGVALDHQVSDLAVWGNYAATASDALALANGGTPLQVGTPSFWFPLGGGAVGSNPTPADQWLSDYTGNGNTLSQGAGSISGLSYAAGINLSSPILMAAYVAKCGKLAMFGTTGAAQAGNGGYPIAPITAVSGTPTIYRNGAPVQVGPPTWLSQTQDSPFVGYLLQCGSVQSIAIQSGGSNYTNPTASASGGGGSGLVLGTPVMQVGVSAYTVQNGGSGFSQPPAVNITDLAGSGSGAAAYAIVWGGAVTAVVVTAGGSGYVKPKVSFSGGGGSGAAAVATAAGGSISAITVTNQGGNYNNPPTISVVAPTTNTIGPNSSIGAKALGVVYDSNAGALAGQLRAVVPFAGGLLGCGNGYSASAPPTITVGSGSGCQLVPTVSGGKITAINIATPYWSYVGAGYPSTVSLNIWDPAGTGAAATATVQNGQITSVSVTSQGSGYTNPVITIAKAGGAVTIQPVVSNYISSVPVTAGGSGYTSPPTITISDPTGAGAVVSPIMSGVSAGDTMTYDAPAAWITPTIPVGGQSYALGGLQAVAGHAMANWTGQREGVSGGLAAFAQTPTLLAGANVGAQPSGPGWPMFTAKNHVHQGSSWGFSGANPGTLVTDAGGTPISWTNPSSTTIYRWCYGPLGSNEIDSMGFAGQFGQWTLQYDDPNVNTSSAMYMAIGGGGASSVVNLSGPNAGTTTGAPVSSQDIAYAYNGGLTSIGLAHTSPGTGYQGAFVRISGGGGTGAVATAVVQGGTVTAIKIICPGAGYTSTPTVTLYGTSVSGTTVKAVFDLEPGPSPTTWEVNATLLAAAPAGTDGQGHWTVGNVWVVAPDVATRLAVASIDNTKPLATDDGVIGTLTTPTGRTPGVLRYMDITQGYGGASNFVLPSDLQDPTAMSWSLQDSINVNFQYARYYNTNPGNATYAWSSPKLYGSQAYFTQQDPPFTITASVTAGSTTITGISGGALMVGSSVSGPGIPAGAYVAAVNGATTATLSAAATASGSSVGLTVTSPNYTTLPANDNGLYVADSASYVCVVLELRSTVPHGLQTGQYGTVWSSTPTNAVPITDGVPYSPTGVSSTMIWVTGPYTIAVLCYDPAGLLPNAPWGNPPQTIASTSEIDLTLDGTVAGWVVNVDVPFNNGCVPYEYAAAMVGQFPGCAYWLNIPTTASDALIAHIAQATAAYIGPTNQVWIEYDNEIWNGFNPLASYPNSVSKLLSYAPIGSSLLGYYVGDGTVPPYDVYGSAVILAAHAQDVFEAAWVAAGRSASQIRRLQGSWFNGPYRTQQILDTAQRWGITVDHVAVAPYHTLPADLPIVTAFSPAGSPPGNAGSWPIDAMNDLFRHWMPYSIGNQGLWQEHAQACQAFGQPISGSGMSDTNATASALLTPTTIASVTLNGGGSGYSSSPVVTLVGGGGTYTSASATVSGGQITAVTVNGASGYTSAPTILIADPPGSGAAARATASGSTVTVTVLKGGSGYKNPQVTLSGGGGSYTAATATVSGGVITAVTVSGASGYTGNPSVAILDSTGSGASATANLTPTSVGSLVITSPGKAYAANPKVSFTSNGGGSGAAATATASGGVVTGATITSGGSGYTAPPTVTISGGGGGLPAAVYYACYTFVDGSGRETTIGLSRSSAGISAGDIPTIGMPAWPTWAQSMNIYLTEGAPGSETLYMTIPRSQYGPGNAYPMGARIPLASGTWANPSQKPPATNLAAANTPVVPTPVTYEGGATTCVPNNVPFQDQLMHDSFCHPSARDLAWGWYASCQLGSQTMSAGGATAACYYQLYAGTGYPAMWMLAFGTAQPAGDGLGYVYEGSTSVAVPPNQYATIQGGLPADGHNHVGGTPGNTSPMLQGFRDWVDASSPLLVNPPTPIIRRRRWFSGLGQNAMRLTR